MLMLALDTCFGALSAAVGRVDAGGGVEVLGRVAEQRATGHAEALFPLLERLVAEIRQGGAAGPGFELARLDRIAVTSGPGTFTGVRTGVAAARALALALSVPVVSVNSLAVIAARARRELPQSTAAADLVVAMRAGRGWLYVDTFAAGDRAGRGPEAIEDGQAATLLAGARAVLVVGTAAGIVAQGATAAGRNILATRDDVQPDAIDVLSLTSGMNTHQLTVTPLYLRPPDARPATDTSLRRAAP